MEAVLTGRTFLEQSYIDDARRVGVPASFMKTLRRARVPPRRIERRSKLRRS